MQIVNRIIFYLFLGYLVFLSVVLAEKSEIKIGALIALTGPYPSQGYAFREGLEMAVSEVNSGGGIGGKSLKLVVEDSANDPKTALTVAKKLLQEGVVAALMSSYPEYRTAGMEFEKMKIPAIALWDSSPELDQMGDFIFGMGPWTPSSGEVAAQFLTTKFKAKTAVIVNSIDPWAGLVSDYFAETFAKLGGKIVKRFEVNPGTSDFRSIFAQIDQLKPDAMFTPVIDHIPTFYQQKSIAGLTMPTVSADIISQVEIDQAPLALEGVFQTRNSEPNEETAFNLFSMYHEHFEKELTMPWFVATAYDSVMIISNALKAGAKSGVDIQQFLYSMPPYTGYTQSFSFNKAGSAPQMAVVYKISNKKLEYAWAPPRQ